MKLVFRLHAIQRMFERNIAVDGVATVFREGYAIEDYPADYLYKSALWLGIERGRPLHVVAADSPAGDERIIITAYEPDAALWTSDWTTRKIMKCPVCKNGDTNSGSATVTLERRGTTLVFKDVPADVCGNCGEAFHS